MEKRCLLLLAVLKNPSGNYTTATRIRDYFSNDDCECILRQPDSFESVNEFLNFVNEKNIAMVMGIHAIHTGQFLRASPVPFILLFGGTDLNVYGDNDSSKNAMYCLVKKAKYVVAFSREMMDKAIDLWPELADDPKRTRIIPQGVYTDPSDYDIKKAISRHIQPSYVETNHLNTPLSVFTILTGIRPVKDPLFLVEAFSEWHQSSESNAYLVIIGPILDTVYGETFLDCIKNLPGIVYMESLDIADAHAAVKTSSALVNSSVSEGCSVAILEAMDLGVPVIVRAIKGNEALVKDGENGLLFSTPQEFIAKADMLLRDASLCENLVSASSKIVQNSHGRDKEREAYNALLN